VGRKSKDYFKSEDRDVNNLIKDLRAKIRRLESDKRKLISEIQGYKKAFNLSIAEIDKNLIDLPVEEVIRIVNSKHKKRVKFEKKQEKVEVKNNKLKWTCHSCNEGHMVVIKYRKASGIEWYHRACSAPKCRNRTTAKQWHDGVEGILPDES
jgi:seryl-tRNA synthetase